MRATKTWAEATSASCDDVFLTVDRSVPHQQQIATVNLAVIVIRTFSNDINDLLPLVPKIMSAIESAPKGEVKFVSA
jgi:hypothetical protein